MTTHDEQSNTVSTSTADVAPVARPESSRAGMEPSTARTDPSAVTDNPSSETVSNDSPPTQREPLTTGDESSRAPTEASETRTGSSTARTEPSTDESLFAHADLSRLGSRWNDVQAAFVDDPKECVQKADALVAEVVEQLTVGFSEARARLETQWARGEQASTEDLRLSLQRYREFFQRLLSV
jgi:hypothetical protein